MIILTKHFSVNNILTNIVYNQRLEISIYRRITSLHENQNELFQNIKIVFLVVKRGGYSSLRWYLRLQNMS